MSTSRSRGILTRGALRRITKPCPSDGAAAVAGYLEAQGVAAARLDSVGMGEGVPIEPNQNPDGSDNPDGRAKNRRVVLTPR